jgi:hypothetical protein
LVPSLLVIAAAAQLCGCAVGHWCRDDDSGLRPPPWDSAIPNPHAGADAPSQMVEKMKKPTPCDPAAAYSDLCARRERP